MLTIDYNASTYVYSMYYISKCYLVTNPKYKCIYVCRQIFCAYKFVTRAQLFNMLDEILVTLKCCAELVARAESNTCCTFIRVCAGS